MQSKIPVVIRGETFPSLRSAARRFNVCEETIRNHLDTLGHADLIGVSYLNTHGAVYKGKSYRTCKEVADLIGCDPRTVKSHMKRYGHADNCTAGKGSHPRNSLNTIVPCKPISVGPYKFKSRQALADFIGMDSRNLRRLVREGRFERILGMVMKKTEERNKKRRA